MAQKGKKRDGIGRLAAPRSPARSAKVAGAGIRTSADFAALMSALMADVIDGRVSADVTQATCLAAARLLKVVEMQYRYGAAKTPRQRLMLAP